MVDVEVDVVVVGGGAMGLSAAWWLAPQAHVVVLERFGPGHVRGASHGGERIFRSLYDDRAYVELAVAATAGWERLERAAGRRLLERVGSLVHGSGADLDELVDVVGGGGVPLERMSAATAAQRWPGMRFESDVLLEPGAGWVRAADTLVALVELAQAAGTDVRYDTPVTALDVGTTGVTVHAGGAQPETLRAGTVVVASGAWTTSLLPGLDLPPLVTTEEQVHFFVPRRPGPPGVVPFIHDHEIERYGLPTPDGRVKVAEHHAGVVTTGDERTFAVDPDHQARVERWVARWLPGLEPTAVEATTCLYTSTPSYDFVLDRVGPVVVAAGFSGHGFKFVPEIGRRLASMALGTEHPDPRFRAAPPAGARGTVDEGGK